jgi:glycosyltransferase involved in cell wall biosynthesis
MKASFMSEYGSRAAHDDGPFVSIIVLNYNRLDALERSLASVVRQTYRRREIIVVDNHSDEDVRKVTDRFANQLRLVQLDSNLGACGGRNCGIQAARGDIIVTIDNPTSNSRELLTPSALALNIKCWHFAFATLIVARCGLENGAIRAIGEHMPT